MAEIKRETAVICKINDLLEGEFVRAEGWSPNYFSTPLGDISRVNLLGVIVEKDLNSVILEDGSGKIQLRSFEGTPFDSFAVGDVVMVIGRPRVYNEQKYVLPEIIKKIEQGWISYRQAQLKLNRPTVIEAKPQTKVIIKSEDIPEQAPNPQRIIEFIRDLDSGSGADVAEVLKRANIPGGEEIVRKLIEEGEVFEIRPGKLKLLE